MNEIDAWDTYGPNLTSHMNDHVDTLKYMWKRGWKAAQFEKSLWEARVEELHEQLNDLREQKVEFLAEIAELGSRLS